uniref:Adhesin n=1 Tax=Ascaris lumbricoides TaxID=6252 RepID=A0A0M3HFL1_ASCLU
MFRTYLVVVCFTNVVFSTTIDNAIVDTPKVIVTNKKNADNYFTANLPLYFYGYIK